MAVDGGVAHQTASLVHVLFGYLESGSFENSAQNWMLQPVTRLSPSVMGA